MFFFSYRSDDCFIHDRKKLYIAVLLDKNKLQKFKMITLKVVKPRHIALQVNWRCLAVKTANNIYLNICILVHILISTF